MNNLLEKIDNIKDLLKDANYVLIGAGAGLSASAGIEYFGYRFEKNFKEFINKYHFTDMYTAGFYNFKTQEEKWAYWAKHIYINCTGIEATKLYKNLLKLVQNKDYFVITTNVDEQFYKAGFDHNKIFATQGSYRYIQCSNGCHNKLYDDTKIVEKMIKNTDNKLKIPSNLVPVCPVCGKDMDLNLRKDSFFVQNENWYKQNKKYEFFLKNAANKKVVLLELGVGFNTPAIIRFPFEQMTYKYDNWNLVRINKDICDTYLDIEDKVILVNNNIEEVINKLQFV